VGERGQGLTLVTLVTLDCRPFDIATSVAEALAAVYSPAVLLLRDQFQSGRLMTQAPEGRTDVGLTLLA